MKKTLVACLALVAVFAVANTASAITCTIDQRPAATLLVPYFAVTVNPDGSPLSSGAAALDTIVTIGNASAAPMIAHVTVFNQRSQFVLDFNIALTGFDIQAMRMSDILTGNLPRTGFDYLGNGTKQDACQRNANATVYSAAISAAANNSIGAFIRVRPGSPAINPDDNQLATTLYPSPAFGIGSSFEFQVIDSLDATADSIGCKGDALDNVVSGTLQGYVTIDHVNYCTLSNPSAAAYYRNDAIGMENNLWGEVIYTSGSGIPTNGLSTVNIEADPSFDEANGSQTAPRRTFYRRYFTAPAGLDSLSDGPCLNCGSGIQGTDLLVDSPWNVGFGDRRESLGLKYAARYFDGAGIASFLRVWRGGGFSLKDLNGPVSSGLNQCTNTEPVVSLTFFDEDENTVTSGVCPSPCNQPSFNFPLETQRTAVATFPRPSGAVAGWINMAFTGGTGSSAIDQAWVNYEFNGPAAFLSISAPGTQLDPSTCAPLALTGYTVVAPVIPTVVGTGR
ncbi:MAG: hypothetical protein ABJC61_08460 [Acidobacteriota bacterium]